MNALVDGESKYPASFLVFDNPSLVCSSSLSLLLSGSADNNSSLPASSPTRPPSHFRSGGWPRSSPSPWSPNGSEAQTRLEKTRLNSLPTRATGAAVVSKEGEDWGVGGGVK
jgi:hypothetical protein